MARPAYFSRHPFDRVVALCLTLAVFGTEWYRHVTFRSGVYDLAVFDQVVWKMAHGHGATSTLTAWNAFGDHLSPVLLVFVPLYRVAATPVWFFAAQAAALGLGILCVRPLAIAAGLAGRPKAIAFLVLAFAISPALWNAALYDFHPTTLAVPLLLVGCTAALRHEHRHMWFALLGLVLLRDDLALAGAAIACVGFVSDSARGRRLRVGMIAACAGWTVLGAQLGTALGASRHFEARYGYLGSTMTAAILHPLHAVIALTQHVLIGPNLTLAVALLLPLALLPLGRPAWLAIATFVALPTLAATDANFHSSAFHYGAPIAPFLLLAAAGALARRNAWGQRAALVGTSLVAIGAFAVGPVATEALSAASVKPSDARAALATLRPTDAVAAGPQVGSHAAERDVLLPFPFPFVKAEPLFPLDPQVTSTSEDAQHAINVVIVASPSVPGPHSLVSAFMASDVARDEFTRTDFGTVLVYRRNP